MRSISLAIGAAVAAAAGCGGGGGDDTTAPTSPGGQEGASTVIVSNDRFTPVALAVTPGAAVSWRWESGGSEHNVTFADGQHSATQGSGSYSRTFATAGAYPYSCTIHGPAMAGTVTVQSSGGTDDGGTGDGGGGGEGGGGGAYPDRYGSAAVAPGGR